MQSPIGREMVTQRWVKAVDDETWRNEIFLFKVQAKLDQQQYKYKINFNFI